MEVEVPHTDEGVICCRTASDPAIKRTLITRVIQTIWLVFCPTFLEPVLLTTIRATEILIQLRCVSTMFCLMVLLHPQRAGILLPQSGHTTFLPWTQANVCLCHIFILANTLSPYLMHRYFLPQCTPMCTINQRCVLMDC